MSYETEKGLESLQVWRKSMDFAVKTCKEIIPLLPIEEKYALADQIRRAVQSIPANIAEGLGRHYYQDSVRFCYIARGSLTETQSHLYFAHQMGYLPNEAFQKFLNEIYEILRMLNGYIAFLKRSRRGEGEPGSFIREDSPLYESEPSEDGFLESTDTSE